jgi:hypothetical protein
MDRGSMTGLVTDPSAAAIVNAKVSAINAATNLSFSTSSSETGNYTLSSLPIGTYSVSVEADGFKRAVQPSVIVVAGAVQRLDFALDVGQVTESVEVTGRPVVLDTESTRVATNVNTKLVEDLPLVVAGQIRSVYNLALIAPEVRSDSGFRIGGGPGAGWDVSMDGSSVASASSNYQTERVPLSSVPVDAIAEFNVESTGMKAEHGRAMGVISFVTKSGANQVHGNLFDFIRNNAADARGFFAQSAPVLKQHDFGGTIGGPVYIPKLYDGRNKTFFFVSYEGFRNRSGNTPRYSTVPLTEMYSGDFSNNFRNGVLVPIYDPASTTLGADGKTYSRTPYAGNKIPTSHFSTVATNYMNLRPAGMEPNVPGAGITNNYFRDKGTAISPWDKYSVRMDHQINASNRLSFLWMDGVWEDKFGPDGPPGLPLPFNGTNTWARKNRSGRLGWDSTISSRILNTARFSYQREMGDVIALSCLDSEAGWGAKLGLKNVPGPDQCLPGWGVTGITTWSANAWGYDRGRNTNFNDDVSIVKGNHTLKMGFFYSKDEWWGGGQHRPNGSFSFNTTPTSIPGDGTGNTGIGFASFLLGQANNWGLETPRAVIQTYYYYGGYFQDDWKINRKLTLNLGLRWEYTSPIHGGAVLDIDDWTDFSSYKNPSGFMNFDPSVPNPLLGGTLGASVYTGDCPECNGQKFPFDSYKKALGPRIGLAYQVSDGTVIRAYAGKSYGAVKTTGGSTHFQGLILNNTYDNSSLAPYTYFDIDNGLPAWTPPPFRRPTTDLGGTTYLWQKSDTGRPPEFYTWNFDIQHELPQGFVATAGYTGTRGVHLSSSILNINQMDPKYFHQYGRDLLNANITSPAAVAAGIQKPYPTFTGSVAQALKPFPGWNSVDTGGSSIGERAGNSTYHSMIVKLDKRYASGLTLLTSYVLSKMFADTDRANVNGSDRAMDHYNRHLEKSLSDDDRTHMFRTAFTYDLPWGNGRPFAMTGVADKILGGWGISGFLEYTSGTPMGVGPGITSVPGGAGNRVFITSYDNWLSDAVVNGTFDPFKDRWWNPNAFGVDANGNKMTNTQILNAGFGNATRNNPKVRSPWSFNENLSLSKDVNVTEQVSVTFRAEAFNIFNRVRWGGPNTTANSNNFGQVLSQGNDPRRMQFALKLTF